ncbi:possible lysyl tRNA synthetase-like protein [Rhodococcus wratislaviensis]|uniref:Possible lysyl tRNA synthetase-like protein n=1 Tax=Rhodococcus wratislaviensis TaxID=44752 RepID=A0A402C331_RHOWR|nr:histone-like nucleoid-structuring protein Lsr2 [Rhodococcus wratislaviensis]GCE37962.1 possible lysyl tRNA synthetase-like protein [Rhodococcus wratislaviensis]
MVVELVDDIDVTVVGEDGENNAFSVNGVDYEIDLKDKHARKFHKQIGFFTGPPLRDDAGQRFPVGLQSQSCREVRY